jgi:bifunctional oligoribonuclease and PAP phosphatase NrnA
MISSIVKAINENEVFIAHAHIGPDIDSLGSVLALKIGLESIGKTVNLFCEDKVSDFAKFLPKIDTVEHIKMENALTYNPDAYIAVDTAKWELATHTRPVTQITNILVINIDHHPDNNIKTKTSWIDGKKASATAMVYEVLLNLNVEITKDIATCLLAGILGDTNVLQNTNTDPQTLELVYKLTDLGADYHTCIFHLKRSKSLNQLKLWSKLLDLVQISKDESFVWLTLDNKQCRRLKVEDLGSFVNNFLSSIKGTKFGALLAEKTPGISKGYLRSRRDVDVSQIAHRLNGGGHKAASGFRIEKIAAQAEKDFLSVVNSLQEQKKI